MPTTSILWDDALGRYRDAGTGRMVGRARIRQSLDQSLVNVRRLTDSLAIDLRAGRISLLDWRTEMRDVIKQVTLASHELAVGGRAQMTPADFGAVGRRVRTNYAYLERWVADIASGLPVDGRMEVRAAMYVAHGRVTFAAVQQEQLRHRGFDEIRSILSPAEHCAECIAEAERGFIPIGQEVPIGSRQCLANDKCRVEYRNSRTGQTVAA